MRRWVGVSLMVSVTVGGCATGPARGIPVLAQEESDREVRDLARGLREYVASPLHFDPEEVRDRLGELGEVYADSADGQSVTYQVAVVRHYDVGGGWSAHTETTRACYQVTASPDKVTVRQIVCDPDLPGTVDHVLAPPGG